MDMSEIEVNKLLEKTLRSLLKQDTLKLITSYRVIVSVGIFMHCCAALITGGENDEQLMFGPKPLRHSILLHTLNQIRPQ